LKKVNINKNDLNYYFKYIYFIFVIDLQDQFQKYQLSEGFDTLGFNYDYDSIMHYGPAEFSKSDLPTIVPKQSNVRLLYAYEKNKISLIDAKEINKYYNC
jgi:hypothetical protein